MLLIPFIFAFSWYIFCLLPPQHPERNPHQSFLQGRWLYSVDSRFRYAICRNNIETAQPPAQLRKPVHPHKSLQTHPRRLDKYYRRSLNGLWVQKPPDESTCLLPNAICIVHVFQTIQITYHADNVFGRNTVTVFLFERNHFLIIMVFTFYRGIQIDRGSRPVSLRWILHGKIHPYGYKCRFRAGK